MGWHGTRGRSGTATNLKCSDVVGALLRLADDQDGIVRYAVLSALKRVIGLYNVPGTVTENDTLTPADMEAVGSKLLAAILKPEAISIPPLCLGTNALPLNRNTGKVAANILQSSGEFRNAFLRVMVSFLDTADDTTSSKILPVFFRMVELSSFETLAPFACHKNEAISGPIRGRLERLVEDQKVDLMPRNSEDTVKLLDAQGVRFRRGDVGYSANAQGEMTWLPSGSGRVQLSQLLALVVTSLPTDRSSAEAVWGLVDVVREVTKRVERFERMLGRVGIPPNDTLRQKLDGARITLRKLERELASHAITMLPPKSGPLGMRPLRRIEVCHLCPR